ncbi:hypothetical protein BVAD3_39760 (plasmid) [Bacillus velezensis]|nr:hypothetical protein BVAD3_39760 [Bacillus velezensis]
MTIAYMVRYGQCLGYCPEKGHIYSVFSGYNHNGKRVYHIWAFYKGKFSILINFSAKR